MNRTEVETLIQLRYGPRPWSTETINRLPTAIVRDYYLLHAAYRTDALGVDIDSLSNSDLLLDLLYQSQRMYQDILDDLHTILYHYESGNYRVNDDRS